MKTDMSITNNYTNNSNQRSTKLLQNQTDKHLIKKEQVIKHPIWSTKQQCSKPKHVTLNQRLTQRISVDLTYNRQLDQLKPITKP
jgi:hypothetical protein